MYRKITVAQKKSDGRWYLLDLDNNMVWDESYPSKNEAIAKVESLFYYIVDA